MDKEKNSRHRTESGAEKNKDTRLIASKFHAAGIQNLKLPPSTRGGQDTLCCFIGRGEDKEEIQKIVREGKNHYMLLQRPMSELLKDRDGVSQTDLKDWLVKAEPVPLRHIQRKQWGELGADFPIFFRLMEHITILNVFLFLVIGMPCLIVWSSNDGTLDLYNSTNMSFPLNATRCDLTGNSTSYDSAWCSTTLIHITSATWMRLYLALDGVIIQGFLHIAFFVLYTIVKSEIDDTSHDSEFLTEASYSVVAKGIPNKETENEIRKKFSESWGAVLDVQMIEVESTKKMEKSVAIVTFKNTRSRNKCLKDFEIASANGCWNRMKRCVTCNSKAFRESLARVSFDGVRIGFIGQAPIFRNVAWDHIHIHLSSSEHLKRAIVNYLFVIVVAVLAYLVILWQFTVETWYESFCILIVLKVFIAGSEKVGQSYFVGRLNEGDKNESSKDSMLVLTLIQLVPFCGAPLLLALTTFMGKGNLGGKSLDEMSTIAAPVATLLIMECTVTPILTVLDPLSLVKRIVNSISSACCKKMPFGPNSCLGLLREPYESIYGPRQILLEQYYVSMLLTSAIPILFGYFFPLSYLLSAVALCLQWISSRWAILRASQHPRFSDGRLAAAAIDLFVQWLLLRPLANLVWTLFVSRYLKDIGVIGSSYDGIIRLAIITPSLCYVFWIFWNSCCPFFLTCITKVVHRCLRIVSDKDYDFAWPPRPLMSNTPYKRKLSRLSYQSGASARLNSNDKIEMSDITGTMKDEAPSKV